MIGKRLFSCAVCTIFVSGSNLTRMMNFKVGRSALLFIAGTVWIVAGANILRIGLVTWRQEGSFPMFRMTGALAVFLIFFLLVFRKLLRKHTRRIVNKPDKSCPFSFFDKKGWIVMGGMIALGVVIRRFRLMPESFISVFYTGLAVALIVTGILFLKHGYLEHKKEKPG